MHHRVREDPSSCSMCPNDQSPRERTCADSEPLMVPQSIVAVLEPVCHRLACPESEGTSVLPGRVSLGPHGGGCTENGLEE
jgi:hypothetical protein